jgi:two-component system response regulator AtoC
MTGTILVVDDETVLAGAIADYLGRYGHAVNVTSSGEEAFQYVEHGPPDIVLLDYRLPRMDGLEVLRKLKETHPKLEVIMLTAHGSREGAVQAMQLGAFDYLNKPVDLEDLQLVVTKALRALRPDDC